MTEKAVLLVMIAYLLGGICTGYYLVYFKTKKDIRDYGSGGVGARNVGRLMGKSGFILTLLGDSFKGFAVIIFARNFDIAEPALLLVLVAVVAGHVWPLQLKFRGGRGIATSIGAYLSFDFTLVVVLITITTILYTLRRDIIVSGLTAFLLLPPVAFLFDFDGCKVALLTVITLIIFIAHRERIKKWVSN